jgi:hypothetical protein
MSIVPQQGSVTFTDNVDDIPVALNEGAPIPLSGGKAALTLIPAGVGTHTITAHYDGVNGSFTASTGEGVLIVQP